MHTCGMTEQKRDELTKTEEDGETRSAEVYLRSNEEPDVEERVMKGAEGDVDVYLKTVKRGPNDWKAMGARTQILERNKRAAEREGR